MKIFGFSLTLPQSADVQASPPRVIAISNRATVRLPLYLTAKGSARLCRGLHVKPPFDVRQHQFRFTHRGLLSRLFSPLIQ